MDGFAKILTDKWKEVIESINVDGYCRKVESVDLFRMNKYYTGHPKIEWCYKATFNFPMNEIQVEEYEDPKRTKSDIRIDNWHKELELKFTNIFYDEPKVELKSGTEEWWRATLYKPRPGSNSGETKFENDRVDYMTNQGYRFIVQFYPQGFISELRNEKLEILGI